MGVRFRCNGGNKTGYVARLNQCKTGLYYRLLHKPPQKKRARDALRLWGKWILFLGEAGPN